MKVSTAVAAGQILLVLSSGQLFAQVTSEPATSAQNVPVVVPEPEHPSYVEACTAFGTGYIKIAGTQTCMRFNGYLRTDYVYTDSKGASSDVVKEA